LIHSKASIISSIFSLPLDGLMIHFLLLQWFLILLSSYSTF